MLDIHEDDGQHALEAAGLTDEFRAIIHEGGQASRVLDQHGTVLLDEPDDGTGGRPEVRGATCGGPPRLPARGDDPVGARSSPASRRSATAAMR